MNSEKLKWQEHYGREGVYNLVCCNFSELENDIRWLMIVALGLVLCGSYKGIANCG